MILQPKYRPIVQRQNPKLLTVRQWSPEATEDLQASLELTECGMCSSKPHMGLMIDDYVNLCVECTVPTKQIKIYPSNKSRDVKSIINKN